MSGDALSQPPPHPRGKASSSSSSRNATAAAAAAATQDDSSSVVSQQQQQRLMLQTTAAQLTVRRRDAAVQIRKRAKEDVLRRKRGLASVGNNNNNNNNAAAVAAGDDTHNVRHLMSMVDAYLLQQFPSSKKNPVPLQQAFSASHRTTVKLVLEQLLKNDAEANDHNINGSSNSQARAFVANLILNLQQQEEEYREAALLILQDMTSVVTFGTSDVSAAAAADDYYGRAPLTWSDLFLSTSTTTTEQPSLIDALLALLQKQQQQQQHTMHQSAACSSTLMVETVCNVLGNLVQQDGSGAPQQAALELLLPQPHQHHHSHWPLLVSLLPLSCYCCAAVIRHDQTHYGMDFLRPFMTTTTAGGDQMAVLANLLVQDDRTATEAAWIIEGLSFREDEVVHALCRDGVGTDQTLLSRLIQRIHHHAAVVVSGSISSNNNNNAREFLVPSLRAVCNLTTACDGRYGSIFLEQSMFVQAMNRLLETLTVIDAVYAASGLLTVAAVYLSAAAGQEQHPATATAATATSQFLPRLVAIVTSDHARLEWKREAAGAIANTLFGNNHDTASAAAAVQGMALHDLVWTNDERHRDKLMQSLIELTVVQDKDAVVPALQILDRLLRCIESSRVVFESCRGVDALEQVCANTDELEVASQLAAKLIDDLFDNDDDDAEEVAAVTEFYAAAPSIANNQFVFGVPQSQQQSFNFAAMAPPPEPLEPAAPPAGRGRGRTMPAWMQQQQPHM